MKNEIYYLDFKITASAGYYWIEGIKNPFPSLKEAKEHVEFLFDELEYIQ